MCLLGWGVSNLQSKTLSKSLFARLFSCLIRCDLFHVLHTFALHRCPALAMMSSLPCAHACHLAPEVIGMICTLWHPRRQAWCHVYATPVLVHVHPLWPISPASEGLRGSLHSHQARKAREQHGNYRLLRLLNLKIVWGCRTRVRLASKKESPPEQGLALANHAVEVFLQHIST